MNQVRKCEGCGKTFEISRDGWLVDSVVRDQRGHIVMVNGKPKKEVRYTEWIHIPGHFNQYGKKCQPAE